MKSLAPVIVGVYLLAVPHIRAQECSTLQSASPDKMASYLGAVTDRRQDPACIAFAIQRLGEQRYEPAIPVLTKFLDFRWPVGAHERQARVVLDRVPGTIYPAAAALENFGPEALPAVVTAMGSKWISEAGLEVAVSVWMIPHRDNPPLGVSLLRQEADNATDPYAKGQLISATILAIRGWCGPSERAQCEEAFHSKASQ